jgi:hypothetical protein
MVLDQQEVWWLDGRTPPKLFGQGKFAYAGKGTLSDNSLADVYSQPKTLAARDSNVLGERAMKLHFGEINSMPQVLVYVYSESPLANPAYVQQSLLFPAKNFDYNKAANISDVAGAWGTPAPPTGFYLGSEPLEVSVTGDLTVSPQRNGCSVVGNLKSRIGSKNIFDLSVTLSGCGDAGEYAGIAFSYLDTGYTRSIPCLRLIAMNSAKTKVFNLTTTR